MIDNRDAFHGSLSPTLRPSLRGAKRRSNPDFRPDAGLLRFARNDDSAIMLKHRAVADHLERRRAVGARSKASLRPAAQVPPSRILASGRLLGILAEPLPDHGREAIEQGHGQRAPFDHQRRIHRMCARRIVGIAQASSTPPSTNRPPLRYSANPVRPSILTHLDAGALQRLDQRIGHPLRQLVQWHQAACRVVGHQRRMPPAIAERDALERDARRPDRPKLHQELRQDGCGLDAAIAGLRNEMIEQAAGPRGVLDREDTQACMR